MDYCKYQTSIFDRESMTTAHYVLLEIFIQRTSHDDLTEKLVSLVSLAKIFKWQKCKTALCDLTEKLLVCNFIG